jgi:hypothetical protein
LDDPPRLQDDPPRLKDDPSRLQDEPPRHLRDPLTIKDRTASTGWLQRLEG